MSISLLNQSFRKDSVMILCIIKVYSNFFKERNLELRILCIFCMFIEFSHNYDLPTNVIPWYKILMLHVVLCKYSMHIAGRCWLLLWIGGELNNFHHFSSIWQWALQMCLHDNITWFIVNDKTQICMNFRQSIC